MKNSIVISDTERISKSFRLLPDTVSYIDEVAQTTAMTRGQIVDFAIAHFKKEREKGKKMIFEVEV